ncbi:MAG: Crp/Fnr family transcriptional regulator [Acidobacteriia bacterium]|nr:Crp/Fnr family transcriptional regulator [Terriglobia bacterium]
MDRPSRCMYLLRSGRVQLANGRGAIVDFLTPGDFFGEKCLLGVRHQGQIATCRSPVKVHAFHKSELLDRMQHDRRFALHLLKSLALRLDRYEQALGDFVTERVERRLARLLSRLAPAKPASGWVRLEFSPTNSELARTIGTTRWQVSHYMRRFQQLGWLARRPAIWVYREGLTAFLESPRAAGSESF